MLHCLGLLLLTGKKTSWKIMIFMTHCLLKRRGEIQLQVFHLPLTATTESVEQTKTDLGTAAPYHYRSFTRSINTTSATKKVLCHSHKGPIWQLWTFGNKETLELICSRFCWLHMAVDIHRKCEICTRCVQRKILPTRAAYHQQKTFGVGIHWFIIFRMDRKNVGSILVVTDHFMQ